MRWKKGLIALIGVVAALALAACSSSVPASAQGGGASAQKTFKALVLPYEAFGPSAMAHELIGMPWWQWQSTGGDDPRARFDVKVVVYDDGAEPARVRQAYPVIPEKRQDYRYVSRGQALRYLDEKLETIKEMPPAERRMFDNLRQRLLDTRKTIVRFFSQG